MGLSFEGNCLAMSRLRWLGCLGETRGFADRPRGRGAVLDFRALPTAPTPSGAVRASFQRGPRGDGGSALQL